MEMKRKVNFMNKEYDIVIVGGGPAGVSLGFLLQKAGICNCIIDKQIFPREKLCGGLLTEKTFLLLKNIYGNLEFPCEKITSSVNLFMGTHKLSGVITNSKFYLVERQKFDNYLLDQYKAYGGMIFEGTSIKKITQKDKHLILENGIEIKYNVLIGADGANSQIRKLIAPTYRPDALCLESTYISDFVDNDINIYFSTIQNGYGWCFPKNKYYTIGIGGAVNQKTDIKELFIKFSQSINKPIETNNIKGAMVPFGKYVKKPCQNNVLLIGDAAGLVDPITGEGIFFALQSSVYAYNSICEYYNKNKPLYKSYKKSLKKIHSIIDDANCFKKIFFNNSMQSIFLNMIQGRTNITKYFCDNILANYKISYMQFPFIYFYVRSKRKLKKSRH